MIDLNLQPLLVFWETTQACDLACAHCRASACPHPSPEQLTRSQGRHLLKQVQELQQDSPGLNHPSSTPHRKKMPILVLTGGDLLKRSDLPEILDLGQQLSIPLALSPAVTPLLTEKIIRTWAQKDVSAVSLSLDGLESFHDGLRGATGTFQRTLALGNAIVQAGLRLQINTTIVGKNIEQLPELFRVVKQLGAQAWEVFFLIPTGRGSKLSAPSPIDWESVCWFLLQASYYGIAVRTVEGPFYRRVAKQAQQGLGYSSYPLATKLITQLTELMGEPCKHQPAYKVSLGTRDGKGIVFINQRGDISPSGFLPLSAGNVKKDNLRQIYRNSPMFLQLRQADRLRGKCGNCPYRDLCGGSRARAYAYYRDYLAADPACLYATDNTNLYG